MTEPKRTLKGINRRLHINVPQALIDQAEQNDSSHCMVAEAIRAVMPEAKAVTVDLVTIRFTDPAKRQRYIYLTPVIVQQALVDFDQGRHNEAFTFRLNQAAQVVEVERRHDPATGQRKKNPPRAVQGLAGGGSRKVPTKLGGELPPVGALSSKGSRRRAGEPTAADKRAAAASVGSTTSAKVTPKKPTAAQKRAAALKNAEEGVAARDRGEPVTDKNNITLAATPSRVRRFGMRQLRA